MQAVRTLVALSLVMLATACATPGTSTTTPHSTATPPMAAMGSAGPTVADPRMKTMQEMHQKMVNASTSAERQALMADHTKAMQGGMAMMREMHAGMGGMAGTGGMAGMGMTGSGTAAPMAGMGEGKGMPAGMAERQQMMTDHMAMMQMMMDMMADRMPPAATGK